MKFHEYESINTIGSSITCPYCGHEWDGSWEICPEEDEPVIVECECGKKFSVYKCITVDYRSHQNCALNNEAHEWEPAWWDKKDSGSETCKKCGMNRYPEEQPRPAAGTEKEGEK